MQKLSFVFIKAFSIKIKYFIAFTMKNFKNQALLRSRKFVEKELIGEEWYLILTQKNKVIA